MSSNASRAARRMVVAALLATSLSSCATHEPLPPSEIASLGVASACATQIRRAHFDHDDPSNNRAAWAKIPGWKLDEGILEVVRESVPNARIGELGINLTLLKIADFGIKNGARSDLSRAFLGNTEQYDYLLAIVPSISGTQSQPELGTGVLSARSNTYYGLVKAENSPLFAHSICVALLYDNRKKLLVSEVKGIARETLADTAPTTVDWGELSPDARDGFLVPLHHVTQQSTRQIMAELIAPTSRSIKAAK